MSSWFKELRKNHGTMMRSNAKKVFFAESFDGTWVMGMMAASVTERVVEVFIGALIGLFAVQIIATKAGSKLQGKLPSPEKVAKVVGTVFAMLGVLFLLRAAEVIAINPTAFLLDLKQLHSIPFILGVAALIAGFELFDKTAVVTFHTSATNENKPGKDWATLISSMVGLFFANIIGVLFLGSLIALIMTPATIEFVSGIIFVLIGVYLFIGKGTIQEWIDSLKNKKRRTSALSAED
ncbi:MAG TPA: TMEM165/GDT1 family protein [Candidatus Magasanikbacteria bacterium]|nr:TMEM165/GDT1 family protein [Candidatus Magasanikbacteria bacterium]